MITAAPPQTPLTTPKRSRVGILASVKLTILLMVLIAASVLIGAWCPQVSQVGEKKVIEQFGEEMASTMINLGIADIFHTPFFLALIAGLTVNMIACSFQRVFPKIRTLKQPLPFLRSPEIGKLPFNRQAALALAPAAALDKLQSELKRKGYNVRRNENGSLTGEWGKYGRLAATVTHIGLLTLMAGVSITSWTGFSGFQPIPLDGVMTFADSEHSKLWVGKLPDWTVRVDATKREDYETGDPKQWYSDLSVVEPDGKVAKTQQISVNNPLSYGGVDIYQSSWGLDSLELSFNGHMRALQLRPMGKVYAAFLPLDEKSVLIFSLRSQDKPLKLFAKTEKMEAPKLITEIPQGGSVKLGSVDLTYRRVVPVTGLQYKCDPGLPIVYVAFAFIMTGILMAAIPHRQLWASVASGDAETEENNGTGSNTCILSVGGRSLKARNAFENSVDKMVQKLGLEHGAPGSEHGAPLKEPLNV
jgi:cytochrome c biogenesis protein